MSDAVCQFVCLSVPLLEQYSIESTFKFHEYCGKYSPCMENIRLSLSAPLATFCPSGGQKSGSVTLPVQYQSPCRKKQVLFLFGKNGRSCGFPNIIWSTDHSFPTLKMVYTLVRWGPWHFCFLSTVVLWRVRGNAVIRSLDLLVIPYTANWLQRNIYFRPTAMYSILSHTVRQSQS